MNRHLGTLRKAGVALVALAVLAALPWISLTRHDVRPPEEAGRAIPTRALVRSSLAWTMALFFGIQSLQAYAVFGWLPQIYRDAGFSAPWG